MKKLLNENRTDGAFLQHSKNLKYLSIFTPENALVNENDTSGSYYQITVISGPFSS
jgi:hypothetical protein